MIDAADCDQGDPPFTGALTGSGEQLEPDHGLGPCLRPRREHRTECHVSGTLCERGLELVEVVRREPEQQIRSETARLCRREIVLTEVHAIGAGKHGEVGPVVGEQKGAFAVAERTELAE